MKRIGVLVCLLLLTSLCFAQQNVGIRVIGRIPDATDGKLYQMQVGAFRIVQNALNAFDKLRVASLNPTYEKYQDLTRVMIKGVSARDVPANIERIRRAGFSEVFIKLDYANGAAAAQPSAGRQPSAPSEDFSPEALPIWAQDNGSESDFPKTGVWKLTGRDPEGTGWKADIVIEKVRNNNFDGYFDWYMESNSDYRGKEYFTGRFDNITEKVFFQGTRLENSKNLALGKYEAYVTTQRDKFYNGRWEEPDGIPKSDWQATLDEE
jgi:hypothetical protein